MFLLRQLFALAVLPLAVFQDSKALDKAEDKLAGGRRDGGKEENPDEDKLKAKLPALAKALKEKREAVEAYNKKRKAVAKECGFMSNVLDAAAAKLLAEPEDLELAKRHAEQLELALGVVTKLKK